MKPKSNWKINLLVLGVTVLVFLLIFEFILRTIRPDLVQRSPMFTDFTHDDTLGWKCIPNTEAVQHFGGQTIAVKINEQGYRDDPLPPWDQVKDKRRVVFLGDSYAWGYGVAKNDRISEHLERLDPTIKSYNFGIPGYSTDQELLTLKRYRDRIHPTDVILLFCLNDLIYNDSDFGHKMPKPHYHPQPDGSLKLGNIPVPTVTKPPVLIWWLRERTAIGQSIYRAAQRLELPGGFKNSATSGMRGRGRNESQLSPDLTKLLLKEMQVECQGQGASLTVVLVPSSQEWTEKNDGTPPEATPLAGWCEELGITYIDLFPLFHQRWAQSQEQLYVNDFSDRMHWNAAGNRLAAQVVYQQLQQYHSVPAMETPDSTLAAAEPHQK